MGNESLSSDEFDWLLELIIAVMFMALGIFGITKMILQLQVQTDVTSRVDKVRVSSIDLEEINPFVYTGYQAYMFAWLMDGHDDTELFWFPNENMVVQDISLEGAVGAGGACYVSLDPLGTAQGFIVKRNRAILGAGEYSNFSVKKTLSCIANNDDELVDIYRGTNDAPVWHLDFTDLHVDDKTTIYTDESESEVFEERKEYVWSLHPCTSH